MSVREQYDLPKRPPVPWRILALVGLVILLALALWRFGPGGPFMVALTFGLIFGAVLAGVFMILSSRRVREPPEAGGQHRPGPGRAG